MKRLLVVVDMQKDFIDGSLGTEEARAIVPAVKEKILSRQADGWDVAFTLDTHGEDYLSTREGKRLPVPHCIAETDGWELCDELGDVKGRYFEKKTIGIQEGELIVGEKGGGPQASPTFPDLCCHTMQDLQVMDERELIRFSVTKEDREFQEKEMIPYWEKRCMRHQILERMTPEWKAAYGAGIFTEFMEQRGPGHTCGGEQVFTTGYMEYKEKIKKTMDALDYMNDPDAVDKCEEL